MKALLIIACAAAVSSCSGTTKCNDVYDETCCSSSSYNTFVDGENDISMNVSGGSCGPSIQIEEDIGLDNSASDNVEILDSDVDGSVIGEQRGTRSLDVGRFCGPSGCGCRSRCRSGRTSAGISDEACVATCG